MPQPSPGYGSAQRPYDQGGPSTYPQATGGAPRPGHGSAQVPQPGHGPAQGYGSASVPQPGHGAAQGYGSASVPQHGHGAGQDPQSGYFAGQPPRSGYGQAPAAPPHGAAGQHPAPEGGSPWGGPPQGQPAGPVRPATQGQQTAPGGKKGGKTARRRRRRTGLVMLLVVAVLLGGGLAGVAAFKPDLVSGLLAAPDWQSPSPVPPAEPAAAPVLAALTDAPTPDPALLKKALDPLMSAAALGTHVSVSVVDVTSGQTLYERDPAEMLTPASNTKLVTAAAVLTTRGPDHRITTRVVAGANPGEVVLIGAGDATLGVNSKKFYQGAAQLDDLAAQVKKAMGDTPITKVITDGTLFTGPNAAPSWPSTTLGEGNVSRITALMINGARTDVTDRVMPFNRYNDPERAAGDAFAKLLGLKGSTKGRAPAAGQPAASASATPGGTASTGPSGAPAAAPAPGAELGSVRSAPLLRQVEQMLTESDNTLAEALAHQVALAKNKPASFATAAEALEEVVTSLGLDPAQSTLLDGSGMSPGNKLTPQVLTGLLVKAAGGGDSHLSDFFNGLPVSGWSGTMFERFAKSKSGFGVVRAKSGTLNGVNSLSGVVQTADGRLLAFAVLADRVPLGGRYPAQDALDKIVAAMATCGCR